MTREHKLALIIGFSIVLLVGVLVSDHLSQARFDALDPVGAAPGDTGGGLVALAPPKPLDTRVAQQRTTPNPQAEYQQAETRLAGGRAPNQSLAESVAESAVDLSADPMDGIGDRPVTLPADQTDTALAQAEPQPSDLLFRLEQRPTDPAPAYTEAPTRDEAPALAGSQIAERFTQYKVPVAATLADRPTRSLSTAARTSTHRVVKGDNLFRLAERYLGDGHLWPQLAAANRDRLGPDNSVRVGTTLIIPTASGSSRTAIPDARRMAAADAPAKNTNKPAAAKTYTVRPGDTLGEIAQRTLGSVRYTEAIITANGHQIEDADEIRVGMVLKIPTS